MNSYPCHTCPAAPPVLPAPQDFVREKPATAHLRSYTLKEFVGLLFERCSLFEPFKPSLEEIYQNFNQYKRTIPVRGAILLDPTMQKCLLVRGWKKDAGWGFPRGKTGYGETDADCAVREVREGGVAGRERGQTCAGGCVVGEGEGSTVEKQFGGPHCMWSSARALHAFRSAAFPAPHPCPGAGGDWVRHWRQAAGGGLCGGDPGGPGHQALHHTGTPMRLFAAPAAGWWLLFCCRPVRFECAVVSAV